MKAKQDQAPDRSDEWSLTFESIDDMMHHSALFWDVMRQRGNQYLYLAASTRRAAAPDA